MFLMYVLPSNNHKNYSTNLILSNEEFGAPIRRGNNTVICGVGGVQSKMHEISQHIFNTSQVSLHTIPFRFPNFKVEFRLNCNILHYDTHSSRKSSNSAWPASNVVHNMDAALDCSNSAKLSYTTARYYKMGAVHFEEWKCWSPR